MKIRWFALVAAVLACSAMRAEQTEEEKSEVNKHLISKSIDVGGKSHRYLVYEPPGYTPDKAWPLIVFLHGAGERGDDGLAPAQAGIGNAIRKNPERFPTVVLFPQCAIGSDWAFHHDLLDAELEAVLSEYKIDPKRIYLTGLSMGGYGTWLWGAIKTDTFAALVPICGGGDPDDIQKIVGAPHANPYGSHASRVRALATLPIWAFHGGSDSVVPPENTRTMVEAIKAAGGNIQYTEFEGVDHNSWDPAYQSEETIAWLLKQKKE